MKKLYSLISLLALMFGLPCNISAQNYNDFGSSITPERYQEMLGRGYDADWWNGTDYLDPASLETTVIDLANAGIQHIRICIRKPFLSAADYEMLDYQVNLCLRYDICPIIAFEPAYYDNPGNRVLRSRIRTWWGSMARHYRTYPARLSFSILWEPNNMLFSSYALLNSVYEDCVNIIRDTNPYRILFISPNDYADPMYLSHLCIPRRGGGFIMAEWHFGPYSNRFERMNEWRRDEMRERRWIDSRIEAAMDWQRRTGIRTWAGGWMPDDNYHYARGHGNYTEYVVSSLHRAGIPFAVRGSRFNLSNEHGNSYRRPEQNMSKNRQNLGGGRRYNDNSRSFNNDFTHQNVKRDNNQGRKFDEKGTAENRFNTSRKSTFSRSSQPYESSGNSNRNFSQGNKPQQTSQSVQSGTKSQVSSQPMRRSSANTSAGQSSTVNQGSSRSSSTVPSSNSASAQIVSNTASKGFSRGVNR